MTYKFLFYIQIFLIVISFIIIIKLVYIYRNLKNNYVNYIEEKENDRDIEDEIKENIVEFKDTNVKEIMTARTSIFALDNESRIVDVLDEIIANGFSRIPVYEKNIDNIIGILYIKDILKADKNDLVSNYIREAFYIPETKTISKLLEEFRVNQKHMAIIIDEYGGTSGLVSIEDILEEIVGEIRDEYDIEVDKIVKIADNIYEIQGETLVDEIDEEINVKIPISDEYDTISGYVQYISGKVPEINEQITTEDYVIRILELENKRIKKIKLILLNVGGSENE